MKQSISILGCGWLGLPLGAKLAGEGYVVKGSTTSEKKLSLLQENAIRPYRISFDPLGAGADLKDFFHSDILIIAIPPSTSRRSPYFHPSQVMNIRDHMLRSGVQKCIYISSTAVYPDANQKATEESPTDDVSARSFALVAAERIVRHPDLQVAVLRCGGLVGYDRNPFKYLSYLYEPSSSPRKRPLKDPRTPVNYIHRDDAVGVIETVIKKNLWGEIYNVTASESPAREEIVKARNPELAIIRNKEWDKSFKIVVSDKIQKKYTFTYPNPLTFAYD